MTPSERLIVAIYREEKWHYRGGSELPVTATARRCGVRPVRVACALYKAQRGGK